MKIKTIEPGIYFFPLKHPTLGLNLNQDDIILISTRLKKYPNLLKLILQHEIDHLNGTLFIDRISKLKRDMYTRRLKKLMKYAKRNMER